MASVCLVVASMFLRRTKRSPPCPRRKSPSRSNGCPHHSNAAHAGGPRLSRHSSVITQTGATALAETAGDAMEATSAVQRSAPSPTPSPKSLVSNPRSAETADVRAGNKTEAKQSAAETARARALTSEAHKGLPPAKPKSQAWGRPDPTANSTLGRGWPKPGEIIGPTEVDASMRAMQKESAISDESATPRHRLRRPTARAMPQAMTPGPVSGGESVVQPSALVAARPATAATSDAPPEPPRREEGGRFVPPIAVACGRSSTPPPPASRLAHDCELVPAPPRQRAPGQLANHNPFLNITLLGETLRSMVASSSYELR